jgi:UDP-glucose 4-epimerase
VRVFLTGASGFVGSHLLRLLVAEGHEVAILLRPESRPWRIADVLGRAFRIDGDLADVAAAREAVRAFGPEVVIHAAWAGVGPSARDDPAQDDNVRSTRALASLAREAGARALIGLGSQAEYGPRHGATREDAPTRPTTRYGAAKLAACAEAGEVCREAGLRFAWLRLFSSYGPMDDPALMIPGLIRTLLDGGRPALSPGTQHWDYLYVEDAARAIEAVALRTVASGVFNLGSGRTATIRSVAERVRDGIDPRLPLGFGEVPFRPGQVMHLEADVGRLREATGWSPEIDLDEGLRRTVAWFRDHGGAR